MKYAFDHVPRKPVTMTTSAGVTRFCYGCGLTDGAYAGLPGDGGRTQVYLWREAGSTRAELTIGTDFGRLYARLDHDALVELARRLIDAAHDIHRKGAASPPATAMDVARLLAEIPDEVFDPYKNKGNMA